jgi:BMFP domain-containing protein YqiC
MESHNMIDLRTIDELTRKLSAALPPGFSQARQGIEDQFKTILSRGLERMDVVSREEFDAQRAVLERIEEKLAALEQQLAEVETSD